MQERLHHIRWGYKILFLSISILLLIVTTGRRHWTAHFPSEDVLGIEQQESSHPSGPYSLTLIGDEMLLGYPERVNQLSSRLTIRVMHLTGLKVDTHVHAHFDGGVAEMAKSVNDLVLSDQSDAVVLMPHKELQQFIGLDESNEIDAEHIRWLTVNFRSNMEAAIQQVNATYPSTRICLSSPSLIGEYGPIFKPRWATPLIARKAEEYREITMALHHQYPGVTFVDIHKALKDSLPPVWPFFSGWLTLSDGQTLNYRGTNIVARLLTELVVRYYQEGYPQESDEGGR